MRILFLKNSSMLDGIGGIETYQNDLMHAAVEAFGEKNAKALSPIRKNKIDSSFSYTLKEIPFSKNPILRKFQNQFSLKYFFTSAQEITHNRPEALICGHVKILPMVMLLGFFFKIPVVQILYGIESWGTGSFLRQLLFSKVFHFVSISQWTKDQVVLSGIDPEKISIVHPCLPKAFEKQAIIHSHSEKTRLLTVGRIDAQENYKGHEDCLKALALLKKTHPQFSFTYQIIGDGSGLEALKDLCKHLNLNNDVEFLLPQENLKETYQKADIFLMPSKFGFNGKKYQGEGFGIVYLEAAAFAVPSIAYDCGGAVDIILNKKTGLLITPNSVEDLALGILELGQNTSYRKNLGKEAYRRIHERFLFENMKRQWVSALKKIPTPKPLGNPSTSQSHEPARQSA